jgi:hypothetical protein
MNTARTMIGVALGVLLLACASTNETSNAPPPSGVISEGAVSMTATVEKVDAAKRLVTLRTPDGKVTELAVSEAVKNLPQVKKGDEVVVQYYESLAYEVKKPGTATPGTAGGQQLATAKPGEMPAGAVARTVEITTTIAGIDKSKGTVTLQDASGNLTPIKVRDPSKLDAVRVGDLVTITYSQAVAVSVERAPK